MVRRGWTQIEVPAGWTQIIRHRRRPSVQWPSARKEIPKRTQSAVSRIQVPKQFLPKTDPVKSKIMEATASLEEVLKKARTEVPDSVDTTSRLPEASLAEANAKSVRLESSLQCWVRTTLRNGVFSRMRWRRSVHKHECEKTSFGSSPIRSRCSTSLCPAAHSFRNRRVDASPKSCGPVGGRSEGKSPIGHGENFSGD